MELYGAAEQHKHGVVICARKNNSEARLCEVYATGKPTPIRVFAWHVAAEQVRESGAGGAMSEESASHGFARRVPEHANARPAKFAEHTQNVRHVITFCGGASMSTKATGLPRSPPGQQRDVLSLVSARDQVVPSFSCFLLFIEALRSLAHKDYNRPSLAQLVTQHLLHDPPRSGPQVVCYQRRTFCDTLHASVQGCRRRERPANPSICT